MHSNRRVALLTLWALSPGALFGCAQWLGEQSVVLTEPELQAMLERRFPMERRLLEVLDIQISSPGLRLLPQRDRLAASFVLRIQDRLSGRQQLARLSLTTGLRIEAADRSLRLKDVQIDALAHAETGAPVLGRGQRLGAVLAEQWLEAFSLYTFRSDRWDRLMAAGYALPTVQVTPQGVVLRAAPKP